MKYMEEYSNSEIWRPIIYEDIMSDKYEVSNFGRIRRKSDKYIMHQSISKDGYYRIALVLNDGSNKPRSVHRIVATAFVPRYSDELNVVNHIDGNKRNNNYMNLEWTNASGNMIHAYSMGLQKPKVGSDNNFALIDEDMAENICKLLLKTEGSASEVVRILKDSGIEYVSVDLVQHIKDKHSWIHISDRYFNRETFKRQKIEKEKYVEMICVSLVKYNGDIHQVLRDLDGIVPEINYTKIHKIKYKCNWTNISDRYFSKNEFSKKKGHFNDG